jgi:type II secretory pathway pseudopilin PulG
MPRREAGLTLVEAAVSMTILAVALLSLWGSMIYGSRTMSAAEERKQALNIAQGKLEELKSRSLDQLIAVYGPSGSEGDTFSAAGIDEDADRALGRIVFYTDETDDTTGAGLGFPMDLNGDGDSNDKDVSVGFTLLPVKVRVTWEGALGTQFVDVTSILRSQN